MHSLTSDFELWAQRVMYVEQQLNAKLENEIKVQKDAYKDQGAHKSRPLGCLSLFLECWC